MFGGFGFDGPFGSFGATSPQKSDNTKYYKVLGVSQNASPEDLRKAHRNQVLKNHPDKGGDNQKFQEIKEAYEVLKDPEKRKLYDKYGENAVKQGIENGAPASMDEFFKGFFSGGRRHRRYSEFDKSDNVVHKIKVSLEEVYNGTTKKLALQRQVKCSACDGVGSASGTKYQCNNCSGTGQEIRTVSFGAMLQQTVSRCSKCNGIGINVPPSSDKCKVCRSTGLISERKVFEVYIEQGMKNGQKITKRGEAGVSDPEHEAGDVIFIIEIKPHPTFKRIHSHLVYEKTITLREALCGIDLKIHHLDGRILKLKSKAGQVIKPDSWMRVVEEGLPIHSKPFSKGNLYINFKVIFPDQLSREEKTFLERFLPGKGVSEARGVEDKCDEEEDVEMFKVDDIDAELKHRQQQEPRSRNSEPYKSDSDGFQRTGGRTVECAHQ